MAKNMRINPNAKYYPPRVLKKLEFVRLYPFALVEAPSGFGKTTLLEYFFEVQVPQSVPRYTYDFESDEPIYIWEQICQCIGRIDPVCGSRLKRCGPPDEDNLTKIHEALQALSCPDECYLWLDNYKRWNNAFSGEFLNQLACHGGKQLHVIVSTQPIPPEKRRKIAPSTTFWQMRDEEIAFRPDDIAAYFIAAGLTLNKEQIEQVFKLTEGWVMALSLQMLCFMEHGRFEPGDMTTLMERAFWERLSGQEQEFLLKLSIFPTFSLGQATALSGLSSIETDHLLRDKRYFIHFDSESRRFYPHAQLRTLLDEHFSCLPPVEKDALEGEYELLISFLEFNRISDMSRHHRRALELLGGPAKLISPISIWTFGCPSILYLYWRESGKLEEELEEMDDCMPIYYELSHGHGSGAELMMRAEAHLMRGETEQALPLCYHALFVATQYHQDSIYQCGLFILCRLAFQQRDHKKLEDMLRSMQEISDRHREDLCRYTYDLAAGYMAILENRAEDVPPWLAEGDINDKRLVVMTQPLAHIIYGRCLLLQKEYHKLLGISQYFIELSNVFSNLLTQVYTHIYCAVALQALGRNDEAAKQLQIAADLALPDRIYLPFAEMYQSIRYLLLSVLMDLKDRRQIKKLAAAYCSTGAEVSEPFTPREQEIYILLKENLTNKEIAEHIGISPNTVRNAVSSMLKKRGFKTRVQLQELDHL